MSQAHHIDKDDLHDDNSSKYEMYQVSSGSSKPLTVTVNLDVEMEVDMGASVSLISEEKLHQLQGKGSIALQSSKAKLLTYTGESIGVLGSAEVKVEHHGQVATLPLIVTKGTGPSLLGRNWLTAPRLDWQKIFTVKTKRTL